MCGYVAETGGRVELKHLAGVLRFPVVASAEGVVLQKIVVTSTTGTKLSGVFAVNCATAVVTPTEQTQSVVTYTLPANFLLSTTEPSVFYISVPAGEMGSATIEFIEASGEKMVSNWNPSTPIKSGIVREFKPITYVRDAVITLETESLPPYDKVEESRIFRFRAMCYNIHIKQALRLSRNFAAPCSTRPSSWPKKVMPTTCPKGGRFWSRRNWISRS